MRVARSTVLLVAGLAMLAALWVAHGAMSRSVFGEARDRAEATLRLTMQALEGHLKRYQAIPALVADDPGIRALVAAPSDVIRALATNRWLARRNVMIDASEIYVMDAGGKTVAASNYEEPDSFVGQNFAYRPYFTEAMAGRDGRFFAIGTTSGIRGFYFSAPVLDSAGRIRGVVAVKVDLDAIEAEWQRDGAAILVTDADGIVFLTTERDLLYGSTASLDEAERARIAATRRYAGREHPELSISHERFAGVEVLGLGQDAASRRDYVVAHRLMPLADWTMHVLLDVQPLRTEALTGTAAVALAFAVAIFGAGLVLQRRARLAEQLALQERTAIELEKRVAERTADIARANAQIEAEVAERRATEQELRRTQADLIQAGKLAALGQMSAALSHEINQPLAAARNYADSAALLIERGDGAKARENLSHILALIDRMATIARHLRNVARKPDQPLNEIDLAATVAGALDIAAPRLTAARADVTVDLPASLPRVLGGTVRLQQVLVNLLSNAADAAEETGDRRIRLSARVEGSSVLVEVRDHGPGVPQAIADRIFDPFFTTKRVGSGLGLGLSISYNIMKDFGGDLRVATASDGGAIFTAVLTARPAGAAAA